MNDNLDGSYSLIVKDLQAGKVYDYKYVLVNGSADHFYMLNTADRQVVVTDDATLHDYRDVVTDWAALDRPAATETNLGDSTEDVYGRVYIENVTHTGMEGRGARAELGYGTGDDPGAWSWSPMAFHAGEETHDEFVGSLTPTARGVYSYAVRFSGNYGTDGSDNPNHAWTYGDLDGGIPGDPFELEQAGRLAVTVPELSLALSVDPAEAAGPGEAVTYTLTLSNRGDGAARGIALLDELPSEVAFVAFVDANGAQEHEGAVSWQGDLPAGATLPVVFTARVAQDYSLYGGTVGNTATYTSANAGSGSAGAVFTVVQAPSLTIAKSVQASETVAPGEAVTYTLLLENDGESAAVDVTLADTLPAEVVFQGFVTAGGAVHINGVVAWNGNVAPGATVVIVFTAVAGSSQDHYGKTVTNTAGFTYANGDPGSAGAAFTFASRPVFYNFLPLIRGQ